MERPLSVGATQKYGSCELRNGAEKPAQHSATGAGQTEAASTPKQRSLLQRAADTIPCLGILLALCASFFLGSAGMLVKMTESVNGIQVAVCRSFIQVLVYGFVIYVRGLGCLPKRPELWPMLGRAFLGGSSITFSYYALKLIPLGDATTIRFSLPIWTLIISYLVLNEPCDLFKVGAVVVSVTGVVLIAKPDDCVHLVELLLHSLGLESDGQFEAEESEYEEIRSKLVPASVDPTEESYRQLEGSALALLSSICLALSLIALRLCKKTPAEIIILWLSLISILIGSATLLALNEWRMPNNWMDVLYILLNGLCGSIGQWFITSALKIEQSGVIALARTFDIQVAFLYSAFLLHEHIRVTSIVGSVLVSCGVIAVVVPKWLGSGGGARAEPTSERLSSASQLEDGNEKGARVGSGAVARVAVHKD